MKRWMLIPLIVVLSFVLLVTCREDLTPPVLSVTPVDLSTVTSFIAFGDDLTPDQKNPCFEYYVNASDVQVRSGVSGEVDTIFLNEGFPDYEMYLRVSDAWYVQYDHVLNLTVTEGDKVSAGDVLGTVGSGNRVELCVENNYEGLAYCPFDYATDSFINEHKAIAPVWCLEDIVVP